MKNIRSTVLTAACLLLPILFLIVAQRANGVDFSWTGIPFTVGVIFLSGWAPPASKAGQIYWPWSAVATLVTGAGALGIYVLFQSTWAAWIALVAFCICLIHIDTALAQGQGLRSWLIHAILCGIAGFLPVAVAQVETRFSDEEFIVALQTATLSIFWLLLLFASRAIPRRKPNSPQRGLTINRRWLIAFLLLITLTSPYPVIRAYQRSFYSPIAPTYEGISARTPFLCGSVPPNDQTFDGEQVFADLLDRVAANPHQGVPEFGMLALGTEETIWAQAFHDGILEEATAGAFTEPANSVKWGQYEAALRLYYFIQVRKIYPDLFSPTEITQLQSWFADINRRAMTVEWVDWMYSLAFASWPEGPYQNQENGLGLLALLELSGFAAPELSSANRDYLERHPLGWEARFHNTDDAYVYQMEWLNNAYFQSLYTGTMPEPHLSQSFEWLLLQALPDAIPLGYNHIHPLSIAGPAYLGATLLEDPRYLWLAGQAIAATEEQGDYIFAQPGVESPVQLEGESPTAGSCLLYSQAGLPNQVGPLAPDKIVFRSEWEETSSYLLLNLRFTGWHRYKATNTITTVYQDTPILIEDLNGEPAAWLPKGRSLFRDKRIPRENLNGLLVSRRGLDAVLYRLTGFGGPWAQDPPFYAEVVAFEPGDTWDYSHTRLSDWQGWQHDRRIYFHTQDGPIVIFDEATGPDRAEAALTWHFARPLDIDGSRILLSGEEAPVTIQILSSSHQEPQIEVTTTEASPYPQVIAGDSRGGMLSIVTIFLPELWEDAEVEWTEAGAVLAIELGERRLRVQLENTYSEQTE